MLKGINSVARGASTLVRHIGQISAWLGLALVLVVSFNVLGRYLAGIGSVALQETEWHLMAAAALMGMSYGLNQGGEVRVDIFYDKMSPRLQALVDLISALLLCAVALIIAWLSIAYVQSSYSIGEGSPDPGGLPHRFALKAVMPVAFGLLALQAFVMFAAALSHLATTVRK